MIIRGPNILILVDDLIKITKGKNRGIKGAIKNIYADGLARIEMKGRKPIYAWLRQLEKVDNRICKHCGNSFNPSRNDPKIKFCSPTCRSTYNSKVHRRRKVGVQGFIARRCPECKLLFVTNDIRIKYCSKLHREKHLNRYRYHLHSMRKEKICKHIYDAKDDPDSISDLIEDWTGIHCPIKDKEESDELSRR